MKALYSYWTASLGKRSHGWLSPFHEMLAWTLSVNRAVKWYGKADLVTDGGGKKALVENLRLPFSSVTLDLEGLEPTVVWSLGKIKSYSVQKEPFVSIDNDVFLWKKPDCDKAEVFAQSPEQFEFGRVSPHFYKVDLALPLLGYKSPSFIHGLNVGKFMAANAGILGFRNMEFCKAYSGEAMEMASNPANREAWETVGSAQPLVPAVICEQWMFGAVANRLKQKVGYLFPREAGPGGAFDPMATKAKGYTHLLGHSKRNKRFCTMVEDKVKEYLPDFYKRCLTYA